MDVLPFALPDISQAEIDGVTECLKAGWLTAGRKVKQFEEELARFVGAKHAIACSSATNAAHLIFDALKINDKCEVIVPAYTFSGPAMMAHRLGAKIVLADCLPGSYQIDPDHVEELITPATALVVPTHFAGQACDMKRLKSICDKQGVLLVDDAAHAFPTVDGSTGRIVGNGKDSMATFFSFYATKTLTTGEGGMITTDSDALADAIRNLRTHGFNRDIADRYTNSQTGWRYDIAAPGWKANMTDVAASLGLVQLHRALEMHEKRQCYANRYTSILARYSVGLICNSLPPGISTPSRSGKGTLSCAPWGSRGCNARSTSFPSITTRNGRGSPERSRVICLGPIACSLARCPCRSSRR